jgi:hypothetical protein
VTTVGKRRSLTGVSVLAAVVVIMSGCLRKEMTSTWYLEPDLSVVWSVLERDVRADEKSSEERAQVEGQFVAEARQNNQPVARGLRQLNPANVRTTLLRDKAPFTAKTDANFPSLKVLGERILGRLGLTGFSDVVLTADGHQWTWSIDPHAEILEDAVDEDLSALFETEVIQIALARGEFVETEGIRLSEDRRIATFPVGDILNGLAEKKGDKKGDEPTVFKLRWKDR